jgi:hypothetical protein
LTCKRARLNFLKIKPEEKNQFSSFSHFLAFHFIQSFKVFLFPFIYYSTEQREASSDAEGKRGEGLDEK